MDEEAFEWYAKGIEKQLRITRLYEYYMMSVKLSDRTVLPKIVLMYFAFDTMRFCMLMYIKTKRPIRRFMRTTRSRSNALWSFR